MKHSGTFRVLAILVPGVLVLLVVHLYTLWDLPFRQTATPELFAIPLGTSMRDTAGRLYERGMISSPLAFRLLARFTNSEGTIRAGEYSISAAMSPRRILRVLRQGKVVLHRVTVPEGLRGSRVAHIVARHLALNEDRFLSLLQDPALIRSLGLRVPSLEGYLLPETYAFPKSATEEQVIRKMVHDMLAFFDEKKKQRAAALGMTLHQVLILASIIEKEAGVPEERPLISSVYHNRLKRGMRLQSDPTVIYGLRHFDGNLRRRDLQRESPYNTYLHRGLPPTPIANPGKGSILAALFPAKTPYLYFVSRNDRTHAFSITLAEHERAVNRYQRRRR